MWSSSSSTVIECLAEVTSRWGKPWINAVITYRLETKCPRPSAQEAVRGSLLPPHPKAMSNYEVAISVGKMHNSVAGVFLADAVFDNKKNCSGKPVPKKSLYWCRCPRKAAMLSVISEPPS